MNTNTKELTSSSPESAALSPARASKTISQQNDHEHHSSSAVAMSVSKPMVALRILP